MSYYNARNNFAENVALVGPNPMSDPQNFNLNDGLFKLTQAIENDMSEIKQLLHSILNELRSR